MKRLKYRSKIRMKGEKYNTIKKSIYFVGFKLIEDFVVV